MTARALSFILLVLLPGLLTSSCAFLRTSQRETVPRPNLHVTETLIYRDTPLGPLVAEMFPRPDVRNDPHAGSPHAVTILNIGDEALLARLHLIRAAQRTISIQTFIWADDATGQLLMHELIEAATRGVKVKIILDQMRSAYDPIRVALAATAHPNMEIKHYNPVANRIRPGWWRSLGSLLAHFRRFNQRMHNKVFIVDDRMAIIGGRNIGNDYFDRGEIHNMRDRDVLVIGPVVKEITESFTDYWVYPRTVPSRELADVGRVIRRGTHARHDELEHDAMPPEFQEVDRAADDRASVQRTLVDPVYRVAHLEFVADRPGKNTAPGWGGSGVTTEQLIALVSQAERTVTMQTPYLVLVRGMKIAKRLRQRHPDIDIRISTNSLAAADSLYAYAFSYKQKKRMVKDLGLRIFEMKPIPGDVQEIMPRFSPASGQHLCIHAKSYVVDSQVVWIGSFNADPRSANLNTEDGLIIRDARVARAIEENILRDMEPQNSWVIAPRESVPIVSQTRSLIGNILELIPVLDLWPFRETASFALREGQQPVSFHAQDFHDRYVSVEFFPEASMSRRFKIRILKTFFGFIQPII